MTAFVYFVQIGTDGPIKIGMATNYRTRFDGLQNANPEKLNIIGLIETPNARAARKKEKEIHLAVNADRIRGEWFNPTAQVLALAASTKPATSIAASPREKTDDAERRRRYQESKEPDAIAHDRASIKAALATNHGNIEKTAEALSMHRRTLMRWMRRLDIPHGTPGRPYARLGGTPVLSSDS